MPWNEDSLGLEDILGLDNGLGEGLSVVDNLSVHIIDKIWLGEVVLAVGVWHCLEVQGHHGTRFNISELVHTSGSVAVSIEEFGRGSSIFWEVWAASSLVELLIEINNVIGLWGEEFTQLLVGEDGVENVDLINGWLSSLISDSSEGSEGEEGEMDLPDEGLGGHQEGEGGVADEASGPSIVGSVESSSDLVEIVSGSQSHLPVIIFENVGAIFE